MTFMCNREIFQCEVYLCIWHVRRAWLKNLVMKVKDDTTRRAMFKRLGDIMHSHKNVNSALEETNKFLNDFQEETTFVDNFQWLDRIGLISVALISIFLV